jgi:hypothetical protein
MQGVQDPGRFFQLVPQAQEVFRWSRSLRRPARGTRHDRRRRCRSDLPAASSPSRRHRPRRGAAAGWVQTLFRRPRTAGVRSVCMRSERCTCQRRCRNRRGRYDRRSGISYPKTVLVLPVALSWFRVPSEQTTMFLAIFVPLFPDPARSIVALPTPPDTSSGLLVFAGDRRECRWGAGLHHVNAVRARWQSRSGECNSSATASPRTSCAPRIGRPGPHHRVAAGDG